MDDDRRTISFYLVSPEMLLLLLDHLLIKPSSHFLPIFNRLFYGNLFFRLTTGHIGFHNNNGQPLCFNSSQAFGCPLKVKLVKIILWMGAWEVGKEIGMGCVIIATESGGVLDLLNLLTVHLLYLFLLLKTPLSYDDCSTLSLYI